MSPNLRMIARIRDCKAVVSIQPDGSSGARLLFTIQPFLWSSREGGCFYTWPQGSSLYHKDFKPTRWWMQGRRLRDKMKNTRPYFMMKLSNVSNVSSLSVKLWPYTSSSLTKFDNSVDDESKKKVLDNCQLIITWSILFEYTGSVDTLFDEYTSKK